ncbi:MAG: DNA replication/repair protein RecF [Bacillota bacterium]
MQISNLKLTNYRNYSNISVSFSGGHNIIMGNNAQGKTNLLESVYLMSTGASPRTGKDSELIYFGRERANVYLEVASKVGKKVIEMELAIGEKKKISLNYLPISKMVELMGGVCSVYFAPDQMKLVKSSPEHRRRFLDIDLCQMSKSYFYTLHKYNEILKQRNALLKKASRQYAIETLPIWNESLAKEGAKIIFQRMKFCEKVNYFAVEIHKFLTGNDDIINYEYVSLGVGETIEEIEASLLTALDKNFEKDFKLQYTSVGPQRDDVKISLKNIDLRSFGSQGQQRTATLALMLSEMEIFGEVLGEYPVLLLDDVLGELDLSRQEKLLKYTKKFQTLITCTHLPQGADLGGGKIIKVLNGRIV